MPWGETMKLQSKQPLARGMEQLSLPSEVLGSVMVELFGDRQVLVSGGRGIRSYQAHEIIVELERCGLKISGQNLSIVTMTSRELLIRGNIDAVGFLK